MFLKATKLLNVAVVLLLQANKVSSSTCTVICTDGYNGPAVPLDESGYGGCDINERCKNGQICDSEVGPTSHAPSNETSSLAERNSLPLCDGANVCHIVDNGFCETSHSAWVGQLCCDADFNWLVDQKVNGDDVCIDEGSMPSCKGMMFA